MPRITLPDASVREYEGEVDGATIAGDIGAGLLKAAIGVKIDDQLFDLSRPIGEDCELSIVTSARKGDPLDADALYLVRHSCAHVMAEAIQRVVPAADLVYGPPTDDGFYYDIAFPEDRPLSTTDFEEIEAEMAKIIAEDRPFQRVDMPIDGGMSKLQSEGSKYKLDNAERAVEAGSEALSWYATGEPGTAWEDLCRGPHIPLTGKIKYFKLLNTSGAYWRGNENNKMLQRIYGTAFSSKKALNKYLKFLEEAKNRDHRKLGKELALFTFDEEVGPGLPLWLPNGTVIIDELEALAKETEDKAEYQRVRTPHLTKGSLYEKSGHLEHYQETMYPSMDVDGIEYYVKPMNCPHHHKIYAAHPKSYRDLPVRLSEYGTCYRYEKSGQLFGLMRVRGMQMNDAHIYCTPQQFKDEFLAVCNMYLYYFDIFGIDKYQMRLGLHDPKGLGGKYIDEPELWKQTEAEVRQALIEGNIDHEEISGEAAFYGPKIDVQVWSAIGKEFTLATNQVDFAIPKRFGLTFTDEAGQEQTPLCIHRAPLSTHERIIGFLIEHYGGDFPLWLAPIQVAVLPVSDKVIDYAKNVETALKEAGIRVQLNGQPNKVGAKIRQAELQRINVMLVVGEKEAQDNQVALRRRFKGDLGTQSLDDVVTELKTEIETRRNTYRTN